jgi:hypothetical protein
MIGDAGEHFAQIGFGIEAVEFRGPDQAIDGGCTFAASIRSGKQVVLPSESYTTQRSLRGVVVDLDVAIFYIAQQRVPA